MMQNHIVKPGKKVHLAEVDPNGTGDWKGGKDAAEKKIVDLCARLDQLQEVLYAEHKHKILVVIQAMDTAGKDGTIRSVFEGVNPQGVKVASFKVPSPLELDHDYLWRVHQVVPGKGELVVFNRSHYEEVLVVRVHNLVSEEVWKRRYQQINDFERMLTEEGTTILKFFLHIDQEEQKQRLLERIRTPEKNWKFNPGDLEERKLWDQYMQAYEEAIEKTSTEWAPWYVIPANRNWYRNLVVSSTIVDAMDKLKMQYPAPVENIGQYAKTLEGA
jgi:PPK2 family polyphosphate:nucleotide phosphotransferase